MNSVAAATEQTTANIQTIVAAVEEMSSTINEIAGNTAKGSQTTAEGVTIAGKVSSKVDALGKAASILTQGGALPTQTVSVCYKMPRL